MQHPTRTSYSGLIRNIREGSVTVVVVEDVCPILCDEKIRKPVIVVISPDAAKTVASAGNAGLLRNVSESAVAVVAIERVSYGDAAVIQVAAIHEVNILPAIAVKVGHAYAGTHNLADYSHALIAWVVHEPNARLCGDVCKLN